MSTVKRPQPSHFGTKQPISGLFVGSCRVKHDHFDTGDRSLFEAHMKAEHKRVTGRQVWPGSLNPAPLTTKPRWSAPKLLEDGSPFDPKALEPGNTVTWTGAAGVERSGQIWSVGSPPKSVWVIPFETLPNEAAVLLVQVTSGRLEHRDTARRSTRQEVVSA